MHSHGLAEDFAGIGIGQALIEAFLGHDLAFDGYLQPLLLQLGHEIGEAMALLTQKMPGQHPAIAEIELGRVLHVAAHLLELLPARET